MLALVIDDEEVDAASVDVAHRGATGVRAGDEHAGDEEHRILEVVVEPIEQLAATRGEERDDGVVLGGAHAAPALSSCGRTISSEYGTDSGVGVLRPTTAA